MKIIDQKEKRSIILIRGFFTLLSMGIIAFGVIAYQDFKEHHHDQVNDQPAAITSLKMNELIDWRDGHLANAEILHQNSNFAEQVREYPLQIILTCFALIFVVSAALGIVWREHRMRYFRQQDSMAETLSKSEERYHNFIMHSFEAISRMEFDHPIDISLPVETQIDLIYENAYIAECNQALADMFNVSSPAGLLNIRLIEVHGGKDNPVNRTMFRKFIENGYKSINEETFEVTAAGKPLWFLSNTIGMIENDHLVRMWSTTVNITERKQVDVELNYAKYRLLEAQQLSHLGNWEWDIKKQILFWSEEVYRIFGVDPSKFTPTVESFENAIHPQDREGFLARRAKMLDEKQSASIDHRIVLPDGQIRYIQENTRLITNKDGDVTRVIGTVQDITERKLAEEALRKNEALLSEAQKLGNIGHWEWNAPATEMICSDELFHIFEIPKDGNTISQKSIMSMLDPKNMERLREMDAKSINERSDLDYEYPIHLSNNRVRWIHQKAKIIYSEDGIPTRMMGTIQDITEYKQAQEYLNNAREFLQGVQNALSAHIAILDEHGVIIQVNTAWREFGNANGLENPDNCIGVNYLAVCDSADEKFADEALPTAQAIRDVLSGRKMEAWIEYPCHSADEKRWFILHITAFKEGSHTRVVLAHENITERKLIEQQLQEAERKYRMLVEYSPVVVYIDEVGGEWQYLSPQVERVLGYSPEDLTKNKLTFKTLIHPDDLQQFQTQLDESLEGGGRIKLEYRLRSFEGNYVWVRDEADVIKDPISGKYYLQGVFYDITEQKKAEETLAANERRYRALIENISDGIELVDARGIVTYASPSAARLLGHSQATLLMPITSLIHLDDLDNAATGFTKVFTTHETVMQSYRALHNDGSWRWLEGSATNRLDDPAIGSIVVTFRDVTERKRAEDALRESEGSFHSLFEDLPIAIWLEDFSLVKAQIDRLRRQGVTNFREYWSERADEMLQLSGLVKVLEINQASVKILGADSKEQVIKNLPNYFTDESLKVFTEEMVAIAEGQTEFRAEIPLLNLRREDVIFEFTLAVQPGHESDLSRVMVSFLDITERKKADNRLKESEARFRQLAENIKEVFWMFDRRENRHVYANPAYQSIFHIDPENVHLTSLIEITHPEDRPVVMAAIEKQKLGEPTEMEYRIQRTDGSTHWIWDRSFPIFDDDGKLVRTAGVATDITENKRAEVELRESESFLQSIVRSAPGYIVSHDLEGYFLYTNHRWPDQSDAEFYNMKLQDLLHPDNADAVMEAFQKAITTHDPQRVEQSVLTPGGGYHWFDVIYSPRIVEGEVRSLTAFAYDINDLKIAQNELLELNSTLEERVRRRTAEVQDLYDNAPNGYHSLDPNGALVLINQTELNWLGYTREEIFEKKMFRELLTPASQLIFDGIFPRFKTTGTISDLTIELIRKDGSILPVLLNASAIYDEYGNFTMSRSITTDITERVRIENALRESRDELSSANIALEKAARLKDEFLASMSHELRTPLTGVLGLSEALQLKAYGELNDRQLKTIKSIEDSGRHLLVLINDILDLSKIEAGKLDLQLMSSSINDICQSSLQLIKGMAQHKKQNIHYSAPDEPIVLNADPRRIKQVLANLLSNAVKFTPENGELGLEIETVPSEKKVKLIVWDKGIGIKPENMHKLFKPFTQIDSSLAREYSGTGLGLSLAHRLVELHHGDIELESVFGEGSRFTVILPWSTQEPSLQINEQESLAQIQFEKPGDSPTVMVADDNETVLELLTDFLESKQYRVIKAHSGDELLSKVAEICPDLILMDIQMPGMDGLDTIRRIRSNADLVIASTPIIAVTALAMPGDRERCLLAGADDYMSKPMKLNELAALIRKMKRKK